MRFSVTGYILNSQNFHRGVSVLMVLAGPSSLSIFERRGAIPSSTLHTALAMSSCTTTPTSADALAAYALKERGSWSLEAVEALRRLVPDLNQDRHKGQLGRIGIFGGSKDYTGAPFFSSMSALRTGADLAYVMTAEEAAPALKAYSPELMVTPVYSAEWPEGYLNSLGKFHRAVKNLLPKLHSLVMGPGMGREQRLQFALAKVISGAMERDLPLVLDADALVLVRPDIELAHEDMPGENLSELDGLLQHYPRLVLTPNTYEFKLLHKRIKSRESSCGSGEKSGMEEDASGSSAAVEQAANFLGGVNIVRKGKIDTISNGKLTISCGVPGGLKRCGGIGDVLSGAMGTFMAWVAIQGFKEAEAEEMRLWAAWWACAVTRHASRLAYEAHGRSMSAIHVMESVGQVLEDIAPSPPVTVAPLAGS